LSTDEGELLGISKYFTVTRLSVDGERTLKCDKGSFRAITCVGGKGRIGDKKLSLGDTYFVSACDEELVLDGEMTLIISSVRKYLVRADQHGSVIFDDLGNIIAFDNVPNGESIDALLSSVNLTRSDVKIIK
jgi:hypothetical protein